MSLLSHRPAILTYCWFCQRTLGEAYSVNNRNSVIPGQIMTERARNNRAVCMLPAEGTEAFNERPIRELFHLRLIVLCVLCSVFRFVFTHPFMRWIQRSHHMLCCAMVQWCNSVRVRSLFNVSAVGCLEKIWIVSRWFRLKLVVQETFCHSSRRSRMSVENVVMCQNHR